MTRDQYLVLSKARELEAKEMALNALDGQLPAGYVLSDNPDQMYGNALFRIKPERVIVGSKSIYLIHRLMHRTDRVDGGLSTIPTTESVHMSCDVFNGRAWETDVEWGVDGRVGSTLLSREDLGYAVRNTISMALTQKPFVNFEWKRDEHDSQKYHLFNGDEKLGSAWKSGSLWGTTLGFPAETLGNAKVRVEAAAMGMIKTRHDERLADWLGNINNKVVFDNPSVEVKTDPYDRNNMDAAVEYSRATSQLFFSGYVDEAFAHYMRDPNGGATASFAHTNKEMFVFTMQGMSGGHMASIHLTQGERQAWCESGASHDEIERIATAGGYAAIRVNGTILTRFQDTLGSVMESRIAGVRNELKELGWVGGLGQSLKKTIGDVELQANLVCMSRHTDEKAVGFNFDVMDVVQGNSSHVVVDNDMNKSAKALAQEVDGAFLERKRAEIAECLGFSSVESMNEHQAWVEQGKNQHDAEMAYQQSDEAQHRKEAASKASGIPVENIVHVIPLVDGQAGVNGVLPELVFEVTFESSGFTNNKEIVGEKLSPSFCGGYTDQANEEGLFPSNIAAVVSGYITDDDHQGESGIRVFASITLLVKAGSEKEAGAIKPPVNLLTTLSDAMSTDFELDGDWEMVNTDVHADLIAVEGKTGIATACPVSSVVLEGAYSGKVTGVDGGVVTQKINREGDVVHHAAARLDKEVKEGDVLDIKYRDGIGAVGGKDKVVEMGR